MKLVQQRGDLPCLGADVDVVKAQAEEYVVGEILASFVDQGFCHDESLGVRMHHKFFCRCCTVEVREENEVDLVRPEHADVQRGLTLC